MRRLRFDKQLIDLEALIFGERAEIHSKFDNREEIESFLRRHGVGIRQNAVRASDLIAKCAGFPLEQSLPRVMLLIDDCLNDFGQTIYDVLLLFTKRGLI